MRTKVIMLMILFVSVWTVYGQEDTINIDKPDVIKFSTPIDSVYKYGLTEDGIKHFAFYIEKSDSQTKTIGEYDKLVQSKDEQISLLEDKNLNLKSQVQELNNIIVLKDEQMGVKDQINNTKLRKEKAKKRKAYVITGVTIVGAILSILATN